MSNTRTRSQGGRKPTKQSQRPAARPSSSRRRLQVAGAAGAVVAVIGLIVGGALLFGGNETDDSAVAEPSVGGDLHAVAVIDGARFVSGHAGAARSTSAGRWQPIKGLDNKDGMAWASVPGAILVGGHEGLYVSKDQGVTFEPSPADLPASDVHALGAAGRTVYLASPQGGLYVSTDGGATFGQRGQAGQSFMGTMLVDPTDPDHVIAPDMTNGVVETRDGGRTWNPLGGAQGIMSVAWDPRNHSHLVATGMRAAVVSRDAGKTWTPLSTPDGTSAVTVDDNGAYLAGVLSGDQAQVFTSSDNGKSWKQG